MVVVDKYRQTMINMCTTWKPKSCRRSIVWCLLTCLVGSMLQNWIEGHHPPSSTTHTHNWARRWRSWKCLRVFRPCAINSFSANLSCFCFCCFWLTSGRVTRRLARWFENGEQTDRSTNRPANQPKLARKVVNYGIPTEREQSVQMNWTELNWTNNKKHLCMYCLVHGAKQ